MIKNINLSVKKMFCRILVIALLAMTVFNPTQAMAVVTLDTNNSQASFEKDGTQGVTPGQTLLLTDQSATAHVGFFALDPDAATGKELELSVTFRVLGNANPSGVDTGAQVIITDGVTSAIAGCVTLGGLQGIGIAIGTDFASPANYGAFVQVDWLLPVTMKFRRTAAGDAEIVEVNGTPPPVRALVPTTSLPGALRSAPSVGFGLFSDTAVTDAQFDQFSSQLVSEAVVPVNGVPPTLTPVTINNSAGDQNDPHISGDLVAYASDFSLHYYSFLTNTDAQIPLGPSARDLLSDVSGSKIVFSRVLVSGNATEANVMVFDAASPTAAPLEIDAANGTTRLGSAIGGNTIAYIDFGLEGNGELIIHELASSTSVRITNDTNTDQSPSVSPDGNVVTWEHCLSSSGNCDIWQAVKTGAVWDVSVVSNTANSEANPDTNGTLVVYDSRRPTNGDLFWHSVNGGEEVQLLLPGFEANPSIAGNLIAFESRPEQASTTDIFVYDIATNLLYRITDTPLVSEQLNDITMLPDCRIRVVWASDEDGASARNIKAATFSLNACNDNTPPVLDSIADVVVTLPLNSTATSTTVTFPIPTATDDSGTATVTTSPGSGAVFPVGTTTVNVTATDDAGNTATGSFTVTVLHNFSGFLQPVENLPILNVINAGQAVAVKFSLSGNKGLNILAAGYPISGQIACDANEPGSVIEETVTAGGSSLSYDAAADRYSYIWKTDKAWKGTCRILALRLRDGSDHFAKFRFR